MPHIQGPEMVRHMRTEKATAANPRDDADAEQNRNSHRQFRGGRGRVSPQTFTTSQLLIMLRRLIAKARA